jgi:hypothetical protein
LREDPRLPVALERVEELLRREREPRVPLFPRQARRESGFVDFLRRKALAQIEHGVATFVAGELLQAADLLRGEREVPAELADRVPRDAVALMDAEFEERARALFLRRVLEAREPALRELSADPRADRARLLGDDLVHELAALRGLHRRQALAVLLPELLLDALGPLVQLARALDELLALLLGHREEPLVARPRARLLLRREALPALPRGLEGRRRRARRFRRVLSEPPGGGEDENEDRADGHHR